jgi:D-alanyl-D-alanine carboxypeptidase/D-alanyl-D-alanine-endopeptidase (penicillin-binding protein 4)
MKVVTAITALDRLGGDYMFCTRLCYTGNIRKGKLTGNLYCVGGFDPMVSVNDVKDMVARLYEMGVDTLRGHIYADISMKEPVEWGEGWCWDDDNPRLTPLSIGRQDTFTDCLMRELQNIGIVLQNVTIGEAVCPANARLVCPCFHPIDKVLERMMKKSDNFFAEALFYQIAASTGKPLCKATDASAIVRQLIRRFGLGSKSYRIADGSGLSLYNYVSAELETMLLRYAWRNTAIYEHLAPSLPIAGVDGTLEKRMRGTVAQGNVRAKTGTLTGISSLAGYCTAANGHQLCFSIINQGVLRGADGKSFQDRVCVALCE